MPKETLTPKNKNFPNETPEKRKKRLEGNKVNQQRYLTNKRAKKTQEMDEKVANFLLQRQMTAMGEQNSLHPFSTGYTVEAETTVPTLDSSVPSLYLDDRQGLLPEGDYSSDDPRLQTGGSQTHPLSHPTTGSLTGHTEETETQSPLPLSETPSRKKKRKKPKRMSEMNPDQQEKRRETNRRNQKKLRDKRRPDESLEEWQKRVNGSNLDSKQREGEASTGSIGLDFFNIESGSVWDAGSQGLEPMINTEQSTGGELTTEHSLDSLIAPVFGGSLQYPYGQERSSYYSDMTDYDNGYLSNSGDPLDQQTLLSGGYLDLSQPHQEDQAGYNAEAQVNWENTVDPKDVYYPEMQSAEDQISSSLQSQWNY